MAQNAVSVYVKKYKQFVKRNPLLASELEVALRWISYFAAGRFTHSPVLSELMHSVSNILTLVNDNILRKTLNLPVHVDSAIKNLLTILSVTEYIEVFAEVAARRIGPKSRWRVILFLQMLKMVVRILLLFKYKQGIHLSPPIPPLNRRVDIAYAQLRASNNAEGGSFNPSSPNIEFTFTLKRSGRVIRTLEAAPPASGRNWKLPECQLQRCRNTSPTLLHGPILAAELAHLSRPLAHLAAMKLFGTTSWKPWMISLIMDAASLHCLHTSKELSYVERVEVSRRVLRCLLYIIRSPFYEKFSRNQIMAVLSLLSSFRILGVLIRPLMEYLPEWQRTYFYIWSL